MSIKTICKEWDGHLAAHAAAVAALAADTAGHQERITAHRAIQPEGLWGHLKHQFKGISTLMPARAEIEANALRLGTLENDLQTQAMTTLAGLYAAALAGTQDDDARARGAALGKGVAEAEVLADTLADAITACHTANRWEHLDMITGKPHTMGYSSECTVYAGESVLEWLQDAEAFNATSASLGYDTLGVAGFAAQYEVEALCDSNVGLGVMSYKHIGRLKNLTPALETLATQLSAIAQGAQDELTTLEMAALQAAAGTRPSLQKTLETLKPWLAPEVAATLAGGVAYAAASGTAPKTMRQAL